MTTRPTISPKLIEQVKIESGHRCAIPTCLKFPIDVHHIIPYSECLEHSFDNLITLCTECHARHHRTKEISLKALQTYKNNLGLLNHRYGDFERRLLYFFYLEKKKTIFLSVGFEPSIFFFLQDNIIKKTGRNSGVKTSGIYTLEEYMLTSDGEKLMENFMNGQLIK